MKLRSTFALLVMLTIAGAAWADAPASTPVTAAITDKKGNSAKVSVEGGVTVVTFTSPRGMGDAEITRKSTSWGSKILLRFDYDGTKKFTRLEGCVVNVVTGVGPHNRTKVHSDFDEKTGTATLTIPKDADTHDVIEISWIDAYR